MKYNQYSFETIKKLINIGKKYANKYNDIDELIYNTDYDSSQLDFIAIGFAKPDFEPEKKNFTESENRLLIHTDATNHLITSPRNHMKMVFLL